MRSQRRMALIPVLVIAAILAATAIVGFGAASGKSEQQVEQEVTELLAGIPQRGTTLGSAGASVAVWLYADVECPTVGQFVESYLPSILERWVRTGEVKLVYRSLQTDTVDEGTFFEQEAAARAAGRQDKMWNYVLSFVKQQGDPSTGYASDEFLTDIALGVPGLDLREWSRNRQNAVLKTQVALDGQSAGAKAFRSTPSFSLELVGGTGSQAARSVTEELEVELLRDVEALRDESSGDVPGFRGSVPGAGGSEP